MYTYQMVGLADQNGRTYISEYGIYNKDSGFVLSEFSKSIDMELLINDLLHKDCWSLKQDKPKPKKMTKDEIEKELGYEIEIDGLNRNNIDAPMSIVDLFLNYFK